MHSSIKSERKRNKKVNPSLHHEVAKFNKCLQHVKYLLKETKKSFRVIEEDDTLKQYVVQSGIPTTIPDDTQGELKAILSLPLCIIVFGQTRYAKAVVINEIFSQNLVPIWVDQSEADWRIVRFKYGVKPSISLVLPEENYELGDNLSAQEKPWNWIPEEDLKLHCEESSDSANRAAILDVTLNNSALKEGARVLMASSCKRDNIQEFTDLFNRCCLDVLPILVYAIENDHLSTEDKLELRECQRLAQDTGLFFVRVPNLDLYTPIVQQRASGHAFNPSLSTFNPSLSISGRTNLSDSTSSMDSIGSSEIVVSDGQSSDLCLFSELCSMGFLTSVNKEVPRPVTDPDLAAGRLPVNSDLAVDFFTEFNPKFMASVRSYVRRYLIRAVSLLHAAHSMCLRGFVLQAYDIAYDLMVTPKRVEFAKAQESKLFTVLLDKTQDKQEEMGGMIATTLQELRESVPEDAVEHPIVGVPTDRPLTSRECKITQGQIREYVLVRVNSAIAARLLESIDVLRETYLGTLERCLGNLESQCDENSVSATEALKSILNSTYRVAVPFNTSSSYLRNLLERMKTLLQAMPWQPGPMLEASWKRRLAFDMLDSLSDVKIAREVCGQISDRLKQSHESFQLAMKRLESRVEQKTTKSEEAQDRIRRTYAPKLARLSLESVSIRDAILYGTPSMGREIGRGQYGVVYSCGGWGPYQPVAVKSVVPPDDKHWNDLALEFYYTRELPEHDRIVHLHGSVIDYSYAGGSSPAVLLVMERLTKDLHAAIKQGLDFQARLQVACDVIEGIRFLHSEGLIHRDIKLKNVLLDSRNRGKLTDLGFCKPHAMMSGSVVGTPIHMAPELFSGKYDSSVDVYAFGILFWYICAGKIRLPLNFEQCSNKDMLWTAVKKGVRPERLPIFDEQCWQLMEQCWHVDPSQRPFPGDLGPILQNLLEDTKRKDDPTLRPRAFTTAAKNPISTVL